MSIVTFKLYIVNGKGKSLNKVYFYNVNKLVYLRSSKRFKSEKNVHLEFNVIFMTKKLVNQLFICNSKYLHTKNYI